MPTRFEDQPWYPKSEVEGSGRARGRCPDGADGTKPGTPEREAVDRESEVALAVFRSLAEQ